MHELTKELVRIRKCLEMIVMLLANHDVNLEELDNY